ncbi:putative C-type lectin domain family 20 member A [Nelusetta ayraudi]|uniref:putative C-type lectin domain family 20 member A n=1 Tax=Nelusetta ayraudi TaxID=303726 RepID=UPI003F70EFBB
MSCGMFIVLVLSGLRCSAFSLHVRQYYFIDEARTWPNAQKYCRRHYTDLATVNDVQDLEILADLTGSEENASFVGLHKSWTWSFSDYGDYHEGERAYWNWASKQPDHSNCGIVESTGKWASTSCKRKMNFICYNASETNILRRFVLVSDSSMTWLDAHAYCKEKFTDLARVENQQENKELETMLSGNAAWLGLRRQSWMWSDGSQPSFLPWKYHQDSKDYCGALDFGHGFHGLMKMNCDKIASFFCHSDPQRRHLVQLKLATKGSPVPRDPAVAASVMNQIQRGLEEKGASKDVKLSWRSFSKEETKQESAKELKKCV